MKMSRSVFMTSSSCKSKGMKTIEYSSRPPQRYLTKMNDSCAELRSYEAEI